MIKQLAIAALSLTLALPAMAEEVDLQLQRREDQTVNAVPGQKLDHQGIIINPTPQSLTLDAKGGKLKLKAGRPAVKSVINADKAVKAGLKPVEGAYRLTVGKKGVEILAYDKAGAFYADRTLDNLLASPAAADGELPYLTILDWPELPLRGVVEGYYGKPWSHESRMALIDFFGKNKMNCYIYGPKNDPYHTSPDWRKPYPAEDAAHLAQLIKACDDNMVKFTWAVHPGSDIKWTETDFNDLMAKFEQLYSLGCRSFAIFFDDIRGEGTNPNKQVAFLNRLTKEFVEAKGDVNPLAMCPTDFTKAWADGSENGPLAIYGRTLDPSVMVMWTGDAVCGDIPRETLQWVDSRTKRPALVWWNYPVTDYAPHILMQGPVYGLDNNNTASDLCGLMSNPMENALASTMAFYGVADYCWNPAAYNPLDNWERAVADRMPACAEAYRAFAINSCDTEFGYRRSESWETQTFPYSEYTAEKAAPLLEQLAAMKAAPAEIRKNATDKMLLAEIDPWLTELEALATRTSRALELMENADNGEKFWEGYLANTMDSLQRAAYEAHKIGTLKWQPFYEDLMDKMVDNFYRNEAGAPSSIPEVIGTFGNLQTPSRKKMFDNDTSTVYFADRVQQDGDFIGILLPEPTPLRNIKILQGRDSNDVVCFDKAAVEYSVDGKEWTMLLDSLEWKRDIIWQLPEGAEAPVAIAVRLKKYPSDNVQGIGIREFAVNSEGITYAFDRNPSTFEILDGTMEFVPADGTRELIMLMDTPRGTVTAIQRDSKGNPLAETTIHTAYSKLPLAEGAAKVELAGNADIYEIIMK